MQSVIASLSRKFQKPKVSEADIKGGVTNPDESVVKLNKVVKQRN
jgi:hypothetical protein